MKTLYLALFLVALSSSALSQEITQQIRGKIFDSESHVGLPGANISVIGSNPFIGTISDLEGDFVLNEVPVGRISIQISYIGYENYLVSDILVSSGKEVVLNIPLIERFTNLGEVVVEPDIERDEAMNKMATLSAKTFPMGWEASNLPFHFLQQSILTRTTISGPTFRKYLSLTRMRLTTNIVLQGF